jgi:hypothetical protein
MTKNDVLSKLLQQQDGRHLGDLCGWSLSGTVRQEDAQKIADACDLADDFDFPRVTPNSAYRRAVRQAVRGGKGDERRYDVAKIEESPSKIVHAVVRKDIVVGAGTQLTARDAEFKTETKLGFDKDAYFASEPAEKLFKTEDEHHPVSIAARRIYEDLCVVYRAEDIRIAFQRAFVTWGAVRLLDHGGLWWVPSPYAAKVRAWSEFMRATNNTALILPVFDTEETIESLRQVTMQSVDGQVADLMEQLTKLSEKNNTRVSTLEKRVEMFDDLRDKAEMYEKLLGHQMDELKVKLTAAQTSLVESLHAMKPAG